MTQKPLILVTGGTGFIGSHTVVELQQAGFDVVIADNLSNSHATVIDAIEKISGTKPLFEKSELCNPSEVGAIFKKYPNIAAVIHFAAYKAVNESVRFPMKYYHNNLLSLYNLLDMGVQKLVFSSSCTVYGEADVLPVTEESPVKPAMSPYGNTKQICEEMIRDQMASGADIDAIALRYFNPIGAHESALIGELPIGVPNNLIPYLTQTAAGKREALSVFGSDYNTPDGTAIRDYIHVVDLAKAHVVALQRILQRKKSEKMEVFNLGTGHGYTVLEVINCFEKTTGVKVNYKLTERRDGDVEKMWADTTLANRLLGWKTELELEDMMRSAWKWECKLSGSDSAFLDRH
jgi:UDP-glucose 4-epimerase